MLLTHVRYGVHLGFATDPATGDSLGHVEVAPFGPTTFSLLLRGLEVAFSPTAVVLDVAREVDPLTTRCAVRLFPVLGGATFAVAADHGRFNATVASSPEGELLVVVPLSADGHLALTATVIE
jgi:hypothetical protein